MHLPDKYLVDRYPQGKKDPVVGVISVGGKKPGSVCPGDICLQVVVQQPQVDNSNQGAEAISVHWCN